MNDISKTNIYLKNLLLVLKGVAMGAANKVPGVSGGIIALIGGFYEELINSFQHFNSYSLKLVLKGDFKSFWNYINGNFLSFLFFGVIVSYFSVSLLLDYLLEKYELFVIGGFFGMILASIHVIIKQVKLWNISTYIIFFIGLSFGLILSFSSPSSENDQLFFVFFCGIISVSGMTIPGLSGSFLLLILGNYNLLLIDAVNALFKVTSEAFFLNFDSLNDPYIKRLFIIMIVFAIGSLFGLILFSNLLKWVLEKFPNHTLGLIIGFICGTVILVYPWKSREFLYGENGDILINTVGNKIFSNYNYYFPDLSHFQTYNVLLFILFGGGIIYLLDYYDKKHKS